MSPADPYLTVAEIAVCYGWTVAYVRKLASRQKWRRRRVGRRVEYLLIDVDRHATPRNAEALHRVVTGT